MTTPIGKIGSKATPIVGGILQSVFTVGLLGLGGDRSWMWLLLVAGFAGGVGNMVVIVGFMVTATPGLADHEHGRATGLAAMTQQIGHHHGHADHERHRPRSHDRHRHGGCPRRSEGGDAG
ncbi:hypothetical protein ACFV5G_08645 [Streptomyces sp. NPDC059766]|uniref:hypothetical protein n=1 Tax=Streptomyces sp. NPDC059766 TaxID=3346940 RepID=UPI003648A9BE